MKRYLLNVYQPDGDPPPAPALAQIMTNVTAVRDEIKAAGAWVFSGGLYPPSTATVVRTRDSDVLMTDGPFIEGKEHVGGFMIILAPDLDVALAWARRLAAATTLPVEVRPVRDE
jgi:hypothetical protein